MKKHKVNVMKPSYKLSLYSLVGLLLFSLGYIAALYTKEWTSSQDQPKTPLKSPTASPRPQYIVDIPAKYFDPYGVFEYGGTLTLKGPEVVLPPVAVEVSETVPYKSKFGGLTAISPVAGHKAGFLDDIDIDNDDQKEQIVFVPTAMNHAAGEIWIIKDGYIIFKSNDGANISITESKSHNGFYIDEAISSGTGLAFHGGYRRTRYIYENGAFRPVWYQESFDLQATKP